MSKFLREILNNIQQNPDREILHFVHPDHNEILHHKNEILTYREFYRRIQRVANLIAPKVQKNDKVVICLNPGSDFIVAFLACLMCDAVAVPVMVPFNQSAAERMNLVIQDSEAKIVLTHSDISKKIDFLGLFSILKKSNFTQKIYDLFSPLHQNIQIDKGEAEWLNLDKAEADPIRDIYPTNCDDDLAFFQYTSGSTANPKGVCVSYDNLYDNMMIITHASHCVSEDVMISWLPPYHDMGLIGSLLFSLFSSLRFVEIQTLHFLKHPQIWLKAIHAYRGTMTAAPNFAYDLVAKKVSDDLLHELDLSCMRCFGNGAEPVRYATLKNFVDRFNICGVTWKQIHPMYGLAEATLMVTSKKVSTLPKKLYVDKEAYARNEIKVQSDNSEAATLPLVSTGHPGPGVEIIIVDPVHHHQVEEGHIGEICVRSKSVAHGYWKNHQATQEVFVEKEGLGNKYLRTGDLGFMYEGELYITGRLKNLIIINGKNYYPQDIEEQVDHAHPVIRHGCCAAFSIPGRVSEELIVVVEVRDGNGNYEEAIHNIMDVVGKHFSLPIKDVVLIKARSIFKTTSGKIQRNKTKEAYLAGTLEALYRVENQRAA